ncbi:MAG: hypothetical protein O2780_03005 [Proteobacteria bacterium]|nr:hypothetical protein [Pseudomonadota bacterium]MDA1301195.1 hypothetical protein [Pseudomonadota bacterium]
MLTLTVGCVRASVGDGGVRKTSRHDQGVPGTGTLGAAKAPLIRQLADP